MKILLTGSSGGIGAAIKAALAGNEIRELNRSQVDFSLLDFQNLEPQIYDWLIFAHGMLDETQIKETFAVNTLSCIYLTQLFLPTTGIIFISSTAGIGGNSAYPVYAASKAAINNYVLSLARKYPNLSFNSVCPGPTNTALLKKLGLNIPAQEPSAIADVVIRIMNKEFKSGEIITVRNGKIL